MIGTENSIGTSARRYRSSTSTSRRWAGWIGDVDAAANTGMPPSEDLPPVQPLRHVGPLRPNSMDEWPASYTQILKQSIAPTSSCRGVKHPVIKARESPGRVAAQYCKTQPIRDRGGCGRYAISAQAHRQYDVLAEGDGFVSV